jgi:hypothetical protein
MREKDHLENPDIGGRIIRWIFRCGMGEMDWIDLAQDRNRWRALVNAIMKLWVH